VPYPRKSFDFLGTPVSALRGGGWGLEELAVRLSFRATDEINNCHFEPIPRLSFRAEGEKSCVSIPNGSEGKGEGLTISRF